MTHVDRPDLETWMASAAATGLILALSIASAVLLHRAVELFRVMEMKELPVPTTQTLLFGPYAGLAALTACAWGFRTIRSRTRSETLAWFLTVLSLFVLVQALMIGALFFPIIRIQIQLSK